MTYTRRSKLSQRFQMGPSTANYKFPTLNYDLEPMGGDPQTFRHAGGKYAGSVVMGDFDSEGTLDTDLDYNEVVFPASNNVGNGAVVVTTGTGAWSFIPNPDDPDTILIYKVQRGALGRSGSPNAIKQYTDVHIPDMGFRFQRRGVTRMTSKAIGRLMTVNAGSFDTATGIPQQPTPSTKTGVWTGTSYANLVSSAARLEAKAYEAEWHNNGKYQPTYALDDSVSSYDSMEEAEIDCGGTFTIGFDANDAGNDLRGPFNLTNLTNGTRLFMRILNIGPLITGSIFYKLQLDMCIELAGPPRARTVDNTLMAYDWPYLCVPDDVDGVPFKLSVINKVTAIA
jgi:hypothetical protein